MASGNDAHLVLPRRPFVSVVAHLLAHDSGLERRGAWLLQAYAEAGMRAVLQAAQAVARLRAPSASSSSSVASISSEPAVIMPTAADVALVRRLQNWPGEPPAAEEGPAALAAELLLSKCRHGIEVLAREALGLGDASEEAGLGHAGVVKACAEEGGRLLARALLTHPPPHHQHRSPEGNVPQAFVPARRAHAEDAEEDTMDNEVEVEGDAAEALREVLGEVHEAVGGFPGLLEGGEPADAALRLPVYPFLEWARMLLAEATTGSGGGGSSGGDGGGEEQRPKEEQEAEMEWEPLAHHHLHHALVDEAMRRAFKAGVDLEAELTDPVTMKHLQATVECVARRVAECVRLLQGHVEGRGGDDEAVAVGLAEDLEGMAPVHVSPVTREALAATLVALGLDPSRQQRVPRAMVVAAGGGGGAAATTGTEAEEAADKLKEGLGALALGAGRAGRTAQAWEVDAIDLLFAVLGDLVARALALLRARHVVVHGWEGEEAVEEREAPEQAAAVVVAGTALGAALGGGGGGGGSISKDGWRLRDPASPSASELEEEEEEEDMASSSSNEELKQAATLAAACRAYYGGEWVRLQLEEATSGQPKARPPGCWRRADRREDRLYRDGFPPVIVGLGGGGGGESGGGGEAMEE